MRLLPPLAYARNTRTAARLNLIREQIAKVEASTTEGLAFALMRIKGIGMVDTTLLACKGYIRDFRCRCHLGHWAGLMSAPWSSGRMDWDQGIIKSGSSKGVPIIFRWLGEPESTLSLWYRDRTKNGNGRNKKKFVVILGCKLLVVLWLCTPRGVIPEGALVQCHHLDRGECPP